MENKNINSFKDLNAWQKAADLAVAIYSATEEFPRSELYGLTNQMRRAAVSIGSNIAEGFKRNHGKEKIQFYAIARGSASELESQIEIAYRLRFLPKNSHTDLFSLIEDVSKLISGLTRSLTSHSSSPTPRSGFMLVDLLVAIGIFAVVASIASGGFVSALRAQRQISSLMAANSNVALALEQMAREIRTGSYFCVPNTTNCPNFPNELVFINANNELVDYRLAADGAIEKGVTDPITGLTTFGKITGSNVNIRYLSFILSGNLSDGALPSRVTIAVGVSAKAAGVSANVINLQTTVSARQSDG